MKNLKIKIILGFAAGLLMLGQVHTLELEGISLSDIRHTEVPGLRNTTPSRTTGQTDDEIGIDLSVKIPFKALNKIFTEVSSSEPDLSLIDPNKNILSRTGGALQFSNIRMDLGGIMTEPVLILRPVLEAKDKISIKIERVKFHALMMPDKGVRAAAPEFDMEETMQQVMDSLIKTIYKSLDKKFTAENRPFKTQEALVLKYDKVSWTLRAQFSAKFLDKALPGGYLGQIHLTGLSFDDKNIYIKIKTDN